MKTTPISNATTMVFILLLAIFTDTLEAHMISSGLLSLFSSPAPIPTRSPSPSPSPSVNHISYTPYTSSRIDPKPTSTPSSPSPPPPHVSKPKSEHNLTEIIDEIVNHACEHEQGHSREGITHPPPLRNGTQMHPENHTYPPLYYNLLNAANTNTIYNSNSNPNPNPHPNHTNSQISDPANAEAGYDISKRRIKEHKHSVHIPPKLSAASGDRLELKIRLSVREEGWWFALVVFVVGALHLL